MSFPIGGLCKHCGYVYDLTLSLHCPLCRATDNYAAADVMRHKIYAEELRDPERGKYYRPQRRPEDKPLERIIPLPEDMHLPIDSAAQIYELKRMFRL